MINKRIKSLTPHALKNQTKNGIILLDESREIDYVGASVQVGNSMTKIIRKDENGGWILNDLNFKIDSQHVKVFPDCKASIYYNPELASWCFADLHDGVVYEKLGIDAGKIKCESIATDEYFYFGNKYRIGVEQRSLVLQECMIGKWSTIKKM